jgi:aryl-alcohol dehydrogenase-like predicted oxidoreductase
MIQSKATPEKTKQFCSRFPHLMHKKFGRTGLTVSACGYGTYRVDYRVREHFDALEYALLNGINLIDSSSNYSDGGSEILIGNVLRKLIENDKIKREELVIVTKGGYIQGKILESVKQKQKAGKSYKEVVEYSENLWHSIHPDFIREQITDSSERMNLDTIDLYLLHNPEYLLDSKLSEELALEEMRHEYYRRIGKAFELLEEEVEKGRIGAYGVSSNSFVNKSDDKVFTSLEECIKTASGISETNHFSIIEFPFNLYERGALINKNQRADTKTLLELAEELELGTIVNRPLNAITDKSLKRLADFETNSEYFNLDENKINDEIKLLEAMENDFLKEYLDVLNLSKENYDAVKYFLKAGELLRLNWKNFGTIENFNDVKKQFLIPRVNFAISTMVNSSNLTNPMREKLDAIAQQVNKLTSIIETIYGLIANMRSKEIHEKLNGLIDDSINIDFKSLHLSQKAILLLNSIDKVNCTLVGMRQKKYVDDVIGSMRAIKIENTEDILRKLEI